MAKLLKYQELQLVEQRIENPRVGGSSPPPGTTFLIKNIINQKVGKFKYFLTTFLSTLIFYLIKLLHSQILQIALISNATFTPRNKAVLF